MWSSSGTALLTDGVGQQVEGLFTLYVTSLGESSGRAAALMGRAQAQLEAALDKGGVA